MTLSIAFKILTNDRLTYKTQQATISRMNFEGHLPKNYNHGLLGKPYLIEGNYGQAQEKAALRKQRVQPNLINKIKEVTVFA
jgi:hypothetical protein